MSIGNEISRRYKGPGDDTPYVPSWLQNEQIESWRLWTFHEGKLITQCEIFEIGKYKAEQIANQHNASLRSEFPKETPL